MAVTPSASCRGDRDTLITDSSWSTNIKYTGEYYRLEKEKTRPACINEFTSKKLPCCDWQAGGGLRSRYVEWNWGRLRRNFMWLWLTLKSTSTLLFQIIIITQCVSRNKHCNFTAIARIPLLILVSLISLTNATRAALWLGCSWHLLTICRTTTQLQGSMKRHGSKIFRIKK